MNYELTSFDELEKLNIVGPIMFDTETAGLYGKITMASFYNKEWSCPKLVEKPDLLDLKCFLIRSGHKFVMYNASYDLACILKGSKTKSDKIDFEDLFLLAKKEFVDLESYSLTSVLLKLNGYDVYKKLNLDKSKVAKSFGSVFFTPEQYAYAAADTFYLQPLWEQCCKHVDSNFYKLYKKVIHCSQEFQRNGVPISEEAINDTICVCNDEIGKIKMPANVNVNSYKQVREYLGSCESDNLYLMKTFLKGDERAGNIRKIKKLNKQASTCEKMLRENKGQRLYGFYSPTQRTGRSSCSEYPLQQIPRNLRHVFVAGKDKNFIYADFSQLELRCYAAATHELTMANAFKNSIDLHTMFAKKLFNTDTPSKEQRRIAKTLNFTLLYGSKEARAQAQLITAAEVLASLEETKTYMDIWRDFFPGSRRYELAARDIVKRRHGSWQTPLGLKYRERIYTEQMNGKIQGFGAEVAAYALTMFMPKLHEDVKLCVWLIDAFLLELPADKQLAQNTANILAEAMKESWKTISSQTEIKDIPMPVKVLYGKVWGDLEAETNCEVLYNE